MKLNYCTNTTIKGHEIFHPDDIRETMRQHYADNMLYIVIDNKQSDNRLGGRSLFIYGFSVPSVF